MKSEDSGVGFVTEVLKNRVFEGNEDGLAFDAIDGETSKDAKQPLANTND
jgi:hypothetical protein